MNDEESIFRRTKHTHFVQKEYLKNFTVEEKGNFLLWRLDKKTGNIKRLSIDKVSVENYFYPQDIEDWLANEIEGPVIPIFRKIIDLSSISDLNQIEKESVARWMIVQDLRTREFRNSIQQGFQELAMKIYNTEVVPSGKLKVDSFNITKDAVKNIQMSMIKEFQQYAPIIASHYHWALIKNNTNTYYYTSDHPVMKENSYLKSIKKLSEYKIYSSGQGYFSKGVELHLPLNPKLDLCLINLDPLNDSLRDIWGYLNKNPQMYPLFWREFPHTELKQLKNNKMQAIYDNVLYYNGRITALSNRFIYSVNDDFSIAVELLEKEPEYRSEDRKRWEIT